MLTGCKKMYYKEYTHIRQHIPKYQGFSLRKFTNLLPKQTKNTKIPPYKVLKYSSVHFSLPKNDPCCSSTNRIPSTDRKA